MYHFCKECETSGLTVPYETLKLHTPQNSQGMTYQNLSKNKFITQTSWVLSKHFRFQCTAIPLLVYIFSATKDIFIILWEKDFLFFLVAANPVLPVTVSQLLLLCNHFKSVTTNISHQWWQQTVNHLYQIRAILVILQSSLVTKLHTT